MKVLIIDDSPDALSLAKARLARERLEIISADNGRDGLETASQIKPDLILLDLDMPGMSGHEVCRNLKSDPDLCMIPVIFLAGSCTTEDKVKALDFGAMDYISKPFDAFELRARVRAALRTKRLQDLLIKYAQIDPLTELWNRRALMKRLHNEWSRIRRHGGSLAFIMADIDHFKDVNDQHGHEIGDMVLREIARILRDQCRDSDFPTRYGGEEFAIIVPNADTEEAARLAERCRREIDANRIPTDRGEIGVTVSFGVADSCDVAGAETVISRADEALYRAKQAGRNRVASAGTGESAFHPQRAAF